MMCIKRERKDYYSTRDKVLGCKKDNTREHKERERERVAMDSPCFPCALLAENIHTRDVYTLFVVTAYKFHHCVLIAEDSLCQRGYLFLNNS